MNYLITGGTGSFGHEYVKFLLSNRMANRICIYSRDEYKHKQMAAYFNNDERLRFFIGDVRDLHRLSQAMKGVDYVIHAAALKDVPLCEYNPQETIKTNIEGTRNVAEACYISDVKKAVFLSTDKAVNPINLYGASKKCAEHLWLSYNFMKPIFNVTRYGNIINSRGSVLELLTGSKECTLTHPAMTRFWMLFREAIELVDYARGAPSGLILTMAVPSFYLKNLFKLFVSTAKVTGLRPGEKMHETLINSHEAQRAFYLQRNIIGIIPERIYDEAIEYNTRIPFDSVMLNSLSHYKLTRKETRERLAMI